MTSKNIKLRHVPIPDIEQLQALLTEEDKNLEVLEAGGSAPPYLLSLLERDNLTVVVTDSNESAESFAGNLACYLGYKPQAENSLAEEKVLVSPALEFSPYGVYSPRRESTHRRMAVLFALSQGYLPDYLILSVEALLTKVPPRSHMTEGVDILIAGEDFDQAQLRGNLHLCGYERVPLVEEQGTYAIRGFILDFFPPFYKYPVRVEYFGDLVESIRIFQPTNQRSIANLNEVLIHPIREEDRSPEATEAAIRRIKLQADELRIPAYRTRSILNDIQRGASLWGMHAYLPAFHQELIPFSHYLPRNASICLDAPERIEQAAIDFLEKEETAYQRRIGGGHPMYPVEDLYLSPKEVDDICENRQCIIMNRLEEVSSDEKFRLGAKENADLLWEINTSKGKERALEPLALRCMNWLQQGNSVELVTRSARQAERVEELLADYTIPLLRTDGPPRGMADVPNDRKVHIRIGNITNGFHTDHIAIIAESEIFGPRPPAVISPAKYDPGETIASLNELKPSDHIVHNEHGIGRFEGLRKLEAGGMAGDYLCITYKGDDKLYLPVLKLNQIHKFLGASDKPPSLDRMGGLTWESKKKKVKKAADKIAAELITLYAAREAEQGHAFSPSDQYFNEFSLSFPFDETPGQMKAINEVLEDLEKPRPMDRLICGDVGYGKTEVAMRAAMKVVLDGKQVAVLVPTTLLAQQHEATFLERFKDYPVKIEALSRFKSPSIQKKILAGLESGNVDIIIGTHRLLSGDIAFADLGLLVIDEEHRFGVRHKEKLKKLRYKVDVLSMSATPIPRTLQMSLTGIRDLSIIASPPPNRMSIRTMITRFDEASIREAILREFDRGGQIFFVHNRVKGIYNIARYLQKLIPEAKMGVAHGQMNPQELERVMVHFITRKINLLITTSIIESGLDIPKANSIFINRADRFGLAQLYQLRGRVGRSHEQAYAYLLIPPHTSLTKNARRRLEALQQFGGLGAGFHLATQDLEIRGAGNLLGMVQAGQIHAIGYDQYVEFISTAVRALKGEKIQHEIEPELRTDLEAHLPEMYIPDAGERMRLYRRMTSAKNDITLDDLFDELRDRFGKPPEGASNLGFLLKIKLLLKELGVVRMDLSGELLILHPAADTRLSYNKLNAYNANIAAPIKLFRIGNDGTISRRLRSGKKEERKANIKKILHDLSQCVK